MAKFCLGIHFKKNSFLRSCFSTKNDGGKKYVPTGLNSQELLMIKTSSFSGLQRMPHADKYVDYDDTHIGAKTLFKWDYL